MTPALAAIGKYRWTVVWFLFFATSINYLDRQIIGLLKPTLEKEFLWTELDYGRIVTAFSIAYAAGLLLFGRFTDRIGVKLSYSFSIAAWSAAAMLHAAVGGTAGFMGVRAFLGLGESGNFPAAIKAVTEWFPLKERAFATGLFNSGANIGAVAAPIAVPWLLGSYGWRTAFVATGAVGLIWLLFWLLFYQSPDKQKKLSAAEYDFIHSDTLAGDAAPAPIPWLRLFSFRQTWAFVFGKALTDPIWWFFLFWLPSYFSHAFQLDLKKPSLELILIYTSTSVGSIGGGYLSGYLHKRGFTIFRARRMAMLVFAFCVVPVMLIYFVTDKWQAVGLISLAAAAHQAWSANIYTTASDVFPKKSVSSIIGIGGMAGATGGIFFPIFIGYLLDAYKSAGNLTGGYQILFGICGCAYLLAWVVMGFFTKNGEKVSVP